MVKKYQVQMIVDDTLNEIRNSLANGKAVKIKGFGSFRTVTMPPGTYHNPKTMEPVEKAGHKKVRFKAGKKFKKQLNEESH